MSPRSLLAEALGERRVAWIAPDVARTLGLASAMEQPLVICHDAMGLADALPFPVHEARVGDEADDLRGSLALLEDPGAMAALLAHGTTDLLLFKVNARLLARAAELGLRVLAGDPAVAQRFEHKGHFAAIVEQLGLLAPRTLRPDGPLPSYADATAALGSPLVVQGARGHSGQSTWLVTDEQSYARCSVALRGRAARLCELVVGAPLTVNGCVLGPHEVRVGLPYYQLTGIPQATAQPLGACGNAWEGERFASSDVTLPAATIGRALGEAGYRGLFGVDLVRPPGGPARVIEVNPRMISGSSMEAMLASRRGAVSPAVAHALVHIGRPDLVPHETAPLHGGQVVFYGLVPHATRIARAPASGRFRLDAGRLSRIDGVTDPTLCADDEVILFARSEGRPLPPGGEYARVQTSRSLLSPDRDVPSGRVEALCRAVRAAVKLA